MTSREELIDAMAKITCAIEGRTHGFSLDEVVAPGIERWMRHRYEAEILLRDIQDAGYVFEKAHAKELSTSPERVKNVADSSHDAPTNDEREALINDDTDDAWQAIADALGNLGYDLNSHEDTAAWVHQYLFTSEPQGEPSDAQVTAALGAYWGPGHGWSQGQLKKMRAALRAAGAAR